MVEKRIIRWSDYIDDQDESCVPNWIDGSLRWAYPLHSHEGQAEVLVVLEGSLRHRLNGVSTEMTVGDAVFITEADQHYLAANKTSIRVLNLAFSNDRLGLLQGTGADFIYRSGFSVHLNPDQLRRFNEYADAMIRRSEAMMRPTKNAILIEFLLWFSRTVSISTFSDPPERVPEAVSKRQPAWFIELVAWAELPGRIPPSLEDMVQRSGKTEEHLCRCFRRFTPYSTGAYLTSLRIRRARDLLSHSNWPLIEVCFASGFESLGRFYATFSAAEGIPPGRFRTGSSRNPYAH